MSTQASSTTKLKLQKCKVCNTEYIRSHHNQQKCSACKELNRRHCKTCGKELTRHAGCLSCLVSETRVKYTEENSDEWVECNICGYRGKDINTHLYKQHMLKAGQYDGECKSKILKDSVKGDKNPGYQHGGKYSAWSDKSEYHTTDEIAAARAKAVNNSAKNSIRTVNYWIKLGYTPEEAKEQVTWYQSRNLKWFIHYYGEDQGTIRWKSKTEKWMRSFKKCNYSKISQELFFGIMSAGYTGDVYFAEYRRGDKLSKNSEYMLKTTTSFVRPDFIDLNVRKIIEFDGDYWHSETVANPERERI